MPIQEEVYTMPCSLSYKHGVVHAGYKNDLHVLADSLSRFIALYLETSGVYRLPGTDTVLNVPFSIQMQEAERVRTC